MSASQENPVIFLRSGDTCRMRARTNGMIETSVTLVIRDRGDHTAHIHTIPVLADMVNRWMPVHVHFQESWLHIVANGDYVSNVRCSSKFCVMQIQGSYFDEWDTEDGDPPLADAVVSCLSFVSDRPVDGDKQQQCVICMDDIGDDCNGMACMGCEQTAHVECLQKYCSTFYDAKRELDFPHCPNPACKRSFTDVDVQILFGGNDAGLRQFTNLMMMHSVRSACDEEFLDCATCGRHIGIVTGQDKSDVGPQTCRSCFSLTCVKCGQAFLDDGECCRSLERRVQSQEEGVSVEHISKTTKPCPKCHYRVEKIDGCNKMVCRCKCVFCYTCGVDLSGIANPYTHFGPDKCQLFPVSE